MNKLLTTGLESKFNVFDLRTQHPKEGFASLATEAHKSTIWCGRHLPQNRDVFVTCGGNGSIHIWKYSCVRRRRGHWPLLLWSRLSRAQVPGQAFCQRRRRRGHGRRGVRGGAQQRHVGDPGATFSCYLPCPSVAGDTRGLSLTLPCPPLAHPLLRLEPRQDGSLRHGRARPNAARLHRHQAQFALNHHCNRAVSASPCIISPFY